MTSKNELIPRPQSNPKKLGGDSGILGGRPCSAFTQEYLESLIPILEKFLQSSDCYGMEDFCLHIGHLPCDIWDARKKSERFSKAYDFGILFCERKLARGGLRSDSGLREGFTKFYLSARAGWRDTQKIETDTEITIKVKR